MNIKLIAAKKIITLIATLKDEFIQEIARKYSADEICCLTAAEIKSELSAYLQKSKA